MRTSPAFEEIDLDIVFDREKWNERHDQAEKANKYPGMFLQLTTEDFLFQDLTDRARDSAQLLHTRMRSVFDLTRDIDRVKLEIEQIWATLAAEDYPESVIKQAKAIIKAAREHDFLADAVTSEKQKLSEFDALGRLVHWDAHSEAKRTRAAEEAAREALEATFAQMGGRDA